MMSQGEWFIIQSGEHEGKPHLSGWMLSAIMPDHPDGRGFANCPRCFAMVVTDDAGYRDLTWAHEQWHAATDYPIPAELLALLHA